MITALLYPLKIVSEGKDGEADDDMDGDGTGVDRIVPHALENDTGTANSVNDGGETGFSRDDIGSAMSSIGGTLNGDTNVGVGRRYLITVAFMPNLTKSRGRNQMMF